MIGELDDGLNWLVALVLSSVRLLVLSYFLPMLRPSILNGITQVGVVVVLASLTVPMSVAALPSQFPVSFWLPLVVKEAFIGLVIGIVVGAIFWAVNALGLFIDQQTGSSQSSVLNPLTEQPGGPSDDFLTHTAIAVVMVSGAFIVLLGAIYESYILWPVLSPWPRLPEDFPIVLADEFQRQAALALMLMLPFMLVLVLIEFVVGLIGRALPSLDGHTFAQGLKQIAVQVMLLLLIALIFSRLFEYLGEFGVVAALRRLLLP